MERGLLNTSECSISKLSPHGRSSTADNLKTVFILILTMAVIMETGALVWMTTTTRQTCVDSCAISESENQQQVSRNQKMPTDAPCAENNG